MIISHKHQKKDESSIQCEPNMEIELSFVHQETILNSDDRNDNYEYAQKLNQLDDKDSPDDPEKIRLDYTKIRTLNTNSHTQTNKNTDKNVTEINVKFEDHILNQSIDDKQPENNSKLALNTSCNVRSQTGIINN